jgi:SAM-dependent methyltransferase
VEEPVTATDLTSLTRDAERLLRAGHALAAERVCWAMLSFAPEQPLALMILSLALQARGCHAEAEAALVRGVRAHPRLAAFHAALGRLQLELNRPQEALPSFENCVLLEPGRRAHRATLARLYETRVFASYSDISRLAMVACLDDDTLTHSSIHRAWSSLLRLDPDAAPIFELFEGARDDADFAGRLTPELLAAFERHTLFQAGLRRFLAADVAIERGLTLLRRWLFAHDRRALQKRLPLLCGLARYCFLTEYVFETREDVKALRGQLTTAAAVALLACYDSLGDVADDELARLAALSNEPCYHELIRIWLQQPLEELAIRPKIPSLTPIEDPISRRVRTQYEENPYPRWTTVGSVLPLSEAGPRARGHGKRLLIAGCGTGREAIEAALNFPAAQVDAVDLSRASLAYGLRQAQAAGVANLSFAQADLLALDAPPERYDFISAVGVLHHLRDPAEGLGALLALLGPGGVMRLALYSRTARQAVTASRAAIARTGLEPTAAGIRAFRASIIARPATDPERAWLTRSYDFYSLSQCRDLVFHVQEHTFSLPEVAALLRANALSVLHVALKSPQHASMYASRFPGDPRATRLENWDELERQEPMLFAGMYDLWLCRIAEETAVDPRWLSIGT